MVMLIFLAILTMSQIQRPWHDSEYLLGQEEFVQNDRPIIGVVTLPIPTGYIDDPKTLEKIKGKQTYVEASYVRWLQAAGARVVPILYKGDMKKNYEALDHVNGLLFTGGMDQDDDYLKFSQEIFQHVLKKNEDGKHFPVMGICLGFEHMAMHLSSSNILSPHHSMRKNLEMVFKERPTRTKLFQQLGRQAYTFEHYALTYQAHDWGISVDDFEEKLGDMLNLISVSRDDEDKEFVATYEAKEFPIYGLQFHPEKPVATNYPNVNIDHSKMSRYYNRYFADFFVDEAKMNGNKFPSFEEEQKWQIENYEEVLLNNFFDKAYVF